MSTNKINELVLYCLRFAQSCVKIRKESWRCEGKCLYLHKIGGISAIEASFIAFGLHDFCELKFVKRLKKKENDGYIDNKS